MEQSLREHLLLIRSSEAVYQPHPQTWATEDFSRRQFPRLQIDCRARIRIGDRQYAGYLHNISQGGAKLRTITPIHRVGGVVLNIPDLPPLRCDLRWTDSYNAGVMFGARLSEETLRNWADTRTAFIDLPSAPTRDALC